MSPSSISSSEGLIETPPELETGDKKPLAWLVIGLFLSTCVATAFVDQLFPLPVPNVIGAELIAFEKAEQQAKLWDGTKARQFEQRLRLTSRVRKTFTPRYSFILYRHLGIVRPVAILGDNGWLFLRSRALLTNAPPDAPEVAANALAAMDRMLAMNGIHLTVAAIPRKSVIHSEHLPAGVAHRPELDEQLMRGLQRRGVNAPDLLEVFQGSEGHDLYHRSGTHWSPYAQAIAARAIAKQAGILVPEKRRIGRIRQQGQAPPDRDLIAFLGIEMDEATMSFLDEHPLEGWRVHRSNQTPYESQDLTGMPRIALAGTSFSAARILPRFLSHFAGELIYNGAKKGRNAFVGVADFVSGSSRPDVIILEIPNHSLFMGHPLKFVGEIFSSLGCGHHPVLVLQPSESLKNVRVFPALKSRPAQVPFLRQSPKDIVHSGDGVVAWHIVGEVTGAGAVIRSTNDNSSTEFPWKAGQKDLFIPVIGASPHPLTIQTRGHPKTPGKMRIEAIELVAVFAEEIDSEGSPGELISEGDRWWQEVSFPEDSIVPSHAGVVIEMGPGVKSGVLVDLEVRSVDEQAPKYELQQILVSSRTRVVLNLSGLAGQRLTSIRISGVGSPSLKMERANIHPLLPNDG